ncbi:MAG: NAD-glutamate dehydrogenase domain-containing protein, partial [Burkholderiaceae bacterium]
NSAGVDTSDHEVNIKILLGLAVTDGEMTEKQRNVLLPKMTDDVAALVLRDNYFQTQALSVTGRLGVTFIDQQGRFMRHLEKEGRLNRAIEYLPTDEELAARKARGIGLTSPELAVLLAYGKMWVSDALMQSDVPEDPWIGTALERHFPTLLREKFAAYIPRHPLKREIVATHVLNSMVNRVGATFVHRLTETTGATPPEVVRAYLAAREVFALVPLWQQIEALDNQVADAVQSDMLIVLGELTARATTWFLRSGRLGEPMQQMVERFVPVVELLRTRLEADDAAPRPRAAAWIEAGVPAAIAQRVDAADGLFAALDVAEVASATQREVGQVAEVQVALGDVLPLASLRQQIAALPTASYWQSLARMALGDDLADLQRLIADAVVRPGAGSGAQMLAAWETRNRVKLDRAQRLLSELAESQDADLAMLSVALRELRNLV